MSFGLIERVIQRDFRVQQLGNRAAGFRFLNNAIELLRVNARDSNLALQCDLRNGETALFLSSDTSAVVSMESAV